MNAAPIEIHVALYGERQLLLRAEAPTPANVDSVSIEQVVRNLLENAIKFRPGGEPIEVDVVPVDSTTVRLAVRDHGIGIPPDKVATIFDAFERAHGDAYGGLGLGLNIARGIVEQHGGQIWAESGQDSGARFLFTLPTSI